MIRPPRPDHLIDRYEQDLARQRSERFWRPVLAGLLLVIWIGLTAALVVEVCR